MLITGATGFIGSNVVLANLAKGNRVNALVLPNDLGISKIDKPGVKIIEGDIRDINSVRLAADGVNVIFHCAAVVTDWAPTRLFEEVTVQGAEHICQVALQQNVSRLVDISTNDVFGIDETRVMDESNPLRPWQEPYPDHKIKAEKILWDYHKKYNLPVTMVYPCWVYGPGDQTFVPLLADSIKKGEMLFWRKNVIVWPTYIENLVDLLMLISEDDRAIGNGYLVHDGSSITLQEFCNEIAKTQGIKPPRLHIPYYAAYFVAILMEFAWKLLNKKTRPLLTTYAVKNLGSRFNYSIAKAEKELGWRPKIGFEEGFAKTLDWLKAIDLDEIKKK